MKIQVLIADDLAIIRKLVVQGLEKNYEDITVDEAKDGKEARELIKKNRYDLVLCDKEMPVMSGDELLTWIRGHQDLNQTPFIMLTTRNEKESAMSTSNTGVSAYLVKPFTIAGLLLTISNTVNMFNRRYSERYEVEAPVTLRFDAGSITGKLIDISLGGFLGFFRRGDKLPHIFDKTLIDLRLEQDVSFTDLEGFVIRIQAAEAHIDSEEVKYAVKFINVNTETEKRLSQYLRKAYPYQW